jgi:adenosylcobinamide-phosphate synthase
MSWGFLKLTHIIHPILNAVCQIILIAYALSVKSLRSAAMDIYRTLKSGGLDDAKKQLSYIVGRDVKPLDSQGVIRGTVETVSENLVDGVVSPLFYAAIGGAPLALTYKMINTLDSMIGYRDKKYKQFGKCAARLDDAANFIPARLSILIISLGSLITRGSFRKTLAIAMRDARNHLSPNAGFPEAAFAGALDVKLGGPNFYGGFLVEKPYIGSSLGDANLEHIRQACDLMVVSSILTLIIFWAPAVLFRFYL